MYEGVDGIHLDGLKVEFRRDCHKGPEGGASECSHPCGKIISCLLIPAYYESCLAFLQISVLVCLVEGFHLFMGLEVIPLRLLESVSEGVRLKVSVRLR